MTDPRRMGTTRSSTRHQAPSPLPQLAEIDDEDDLSGPMGLVSLMDRECLLAMLSTHAAVDTRRGVGEFGGNKEPGDGGGLPKGVLARLASPVDLQGAVADDRPSPEPPDLPHCSASDLRLPKHYNEGSGCRVF
ncbi:unnamed protein product [Pylaiella littoralis]